MKSLELVNNFKHFISDSISQSIALTPRSSPKGMATADDSPPLPIHALPSCPLQPISPHSPLTHILLHPIFPFSKGPSPPIRTISTTHIHLLNKFLISHPFQYGQTISGCSFLLIPPHNTTPHFHVLSCLTSHAHSCCPAHHAPLR